MVSASRISAVLCFGVVAIAAAACSREGTTRLPMGVDASATQVIPYDTATSGGGSTEPDTVTASNPGHQCPQDDAEAVQGPSGYVELPPLPPCSTDPVIQ